MRRSMPGTWLVVVAAALLLRSISHAAETEAPHHPSASAEHHSSAAEPSDYPHPEVAPTAIWAGATVVGILFMFFAAACVGLFVRSEAVVEMPVTHAHDEPPGSSHHHGASGTHVVDPHD